MLFISFCEMLCTSDAVLFNLYDVLYFYFIAPINNNEFFGNIKKFFYIISFNLSRTEK